MVLAAVAASLVAAAPASGSALLSSDLGARRALDRSCGAHLGSARGARVARRPTAPGSGWLCAPPPAAAGPGDWDVAVFDRATHRLVAGSADFGSNELATGRKGIKGKHVGPAVLGRSRKRQRRLIKSRRLKGRRQVDRYCVAGGGSLRIGYPTRRLNRRWSRRSRRRYKSKAILAISSSKRFKVKRVRVGTGARTARRRLRLRRIKVGTSVWYVISGKQSRILFRIKRDKVADIGLASKRLHAHPLGRPVACCTHGAGVPRRPVSTASISPDSYRRIE